ncbi:stonustoxin subunit alpha-like [Apteryx rowi]|uniref:stonustoxin subunit alpha-like n=1 Tax=Apteryx rowi TaxID=308060 RepID=UPI000E1D9FCB|nr:stonustoxin subunit alpha-like [Apteryx rowi]XP_025913035.1 stonustoxin subunit alpha-like [Apteryx rowi]
MAKADDTVEMPTLGRPFQLGMLYDCRKELLIPGITLWGLDTLQKNVDVRSQNKTEFQIIASDSMEDKASALDIKASLQVSFLSGMVNVSGSAEYLRDNRSSKRQARVTLQYSATTQFKQLTMNQLGRQNISYPDVFDQGTATHVVTAVLYGAQAFFVFDREVSENENIQEIQGRLKLAISGIPATKIEGEASVKMDEKDKSFTEKLSCQFHGDFALESNPVTYEDAMQVYAALPKMLGANGEKAVPVKVWLYPLTKLNAKAACLVREISLALVFDAQTALEQLTELDMRCNDLQRNPVATSFPEIKRKLQQFKDLCKQHRQAFQKELAGLLPSIRGGEEEERALVDVLTCYNQSPFNTQLLKEFLDTKEREMIFVKFHLSLLKDLAVVSTQNELAEIVFDPMNHFVISFTFTALHEEEPYLCSLKLWLQPQFSRNTQDLASVSLEREKTKPQMWFEDKAGYQYARKAAKALSEFAQVNKSNEKIRFVVSSVSDKANPGASIYLYEDGELVNTNFEPPAMPLRPTAGRVKHDSVQLMFEPSNYGKAAISHYWVEYRLAGQESWMGLETPDSEGTFTVTGLHANTEYQFRYAAVSKPGFSGSSDSSDTVKTLPTSPP